MPPVENRLLPQLDKAPVIPLNAKAYKYERRFRDIRGPELIHNTLMYKQYGIIVSEACFDGLVIVMSSLYHRLCRAAI